MTDEPWRPAERRMERGIAAILLAMLAFACILVLRPFLSALLWAAILCSSTWPLFLRLETLLRGRHSLAAAIMAGAAAAIFLLPLAASVSRLTAEASDIAALVSRWLEIGPPPPPEWVATIPAIGGRLDAYWQSVAHDGAKLTADLRAYVGPVREWIVSAGLSLGSGLTELVFALLISFFFYRDGMTGIEALRSALARVGGATAPHLLDVAGITIRSVVYGILGTNLAQATLAGLGLWIAGVPNALFLGFALFFLCLIPAAPLIVFAPAIVWLLHQDARVEAIFLAAWYVAVFVIGEGALRSWLISRGGVLPLLLVFLGIIGGIATFGLLGIFLGPTVLALAHALLREWNAAEQEIAAASGRQEESRRIAGAR